MGSGTVHAVTAAEAASGTDRMAPAAAADPASDSSPGARRQPPGQPGQQADKLWLTREPVEPIPDEPTAVLVAGVADSGRSAVVGALLGAAGPIGDLPAGSYLVIGHGRGGEHAAYVPGFRQAQPHRPTGSASGAGAIARPPRRIEMTMPDPLLRHFALLDSPDADSLGTAGTRILLDVAERGGALVYVTAADRTLNGAELDLLAEVATRKVAVFFALTPGRRERAAVGGGSVPAVYGDAAPVVDDGAAAAADAAPSAAAAQILDANPIAAAIGSHRAAVVARAPDLVDAPWFAVDPGAGDTAYLRRALVEWAGVEGLRRASSNPPVWPSSGRTVRAASDAAESGWQELLDRLIRTSGHTVRQRLAIEVANIHLRCVQEIVFGTGCAGMPSALDRELHALSLLATSESDAAMDRVVDAVLGRVLELEPDPGVRRRVVIALRRGLAEDPAATDLDRVLLVTSTGGVAGVVGTGALTALPAYLSRPDTGVLPPVGAGLSGGCYLLWRSAQNDDPNKARSWLQRSIRGVELDLLREVTRRFEAVRRALTTLVSETVDHGILLV
jgi:hypothetical protein